MERSSCIGVEIATEMDDKGGAQSRVQVAGKVDRLIWRETEWIGKNLSQHLKNPKNAKNSDKPE